MNKFLHDEAATQVVERLEGKRTNQPIRSIQIAIAAIKMSGHPEHDRAMVLSDLCDLASHISRNPLVSTYNRFVQLLHEDSDYAWAHHCTITYILETHADMTHKQANIIAAKLMVAMFDVHTERYKTFKRFEQAAWNARANPFQKLLGWVHNKTRRYADFAK